MGFIKKCVSYLAGSMLIQVALIFASIYLLMVFLPNYVGCILPEKMCMTRQNDGDDVNDVLAITAALMPSLLVIYGYKIWRSQKAKELLAAKAQDIYFGLDEIIKVLNKYSEQIESSPETITRDCVIYIDVKKACDDISESILLFRDLLTEEHSPYSSNLDSFYKQITIFEFNAKSIKKISSIGGKLSLEVSEYIKIKEIVFILSLPQAINVIKENLIKIILHK